MDSDQYQLLYDIELDHWWFEGMRRFSRALLRKHLAPGRTYQLLDAGCGTGGTSLDLTRYGTVTALDVSHEAVTLASRRGLRRLVRGTVEALPFSDGCFDLVTSFDVLYHRAVGDERKTLAEFRRVLRPGGLALVRVPAFEWLRGSHDERVHTGRRFTLAELKSLLQDVGFHIRDATYANMFLLPLAMMKRAAERWLPDTPADLSTPPRVVNATLAGVLGLEASLVSWARLPAGVSAYVVGQVP